MEDIKRMLSHLDSHAELLTPVIIGEAEGKTYTGRAGDSGLVR